MSALMAAGFELMLVGMGTVFVFLTVLVAATYGMSALVQRWLPNAQVPSVSEGETEISAEEVAAITVALAEHRRRGHS